MKAKQKEETKGKEKRKQPKATQRNVHNAKQSMFKV
jgi:hypothetical protein